MLALLSVALAARVDTTALAFAWPAGVDLPVRVDVTEVVRVAGEARRRCFSLETRLQTRPGPGGLEVHFDTLTDVLPGDECPVFVELRPWLPQPFVVDAAGHLPGEATPDDRALREWWNRHVGFWAGRSATRDGEASRAARATPVLGWEVADVAVGASLTDVERRTGRVTLDLALAPDPAAVTDWFRRLHATAPELGGSVGAAELAERVTVVADPTTLLPSVWEDHLVVALTMAEPPGTAQRELHTRWTFGAPERGAKDEPRKK